MEDQNISSIYRQYKKDTDSVASWLASTARQHGYPLDLLPTDQGNTSTPKSTRRLKGKARRESRNAAPKTGKYIIPLHDFTQLASFIARKHPPVAVPTSLISTISRLIDLRTGFGKLLAQQGYPYSSESEARHDYFVNILKGVRDILQPPPPANTKLQANRKYENKKAAQPSGSGFVNRFSALSIDEPSQDFLERFAKECEHANRPSQSADDPTVFEAEPETSEEELMLLCSALLRDLNEIRSSIHPMWPQKATTWDPAAFSISTNVAISLGRGLIDEVEPLLEKAKGGSLLMMETMASIMEKTAKAKAKAKDKDKAKVSPPAAPGIPSNALSEAFKNLGDPYFSSFSNSIRSLKAQHERMAIRDGFVISPCDADQIDLTRPPSVRSEEEWFYQDALRIEHYFCDMMLVLQTMGGFPIEDELFRAVRRYKNTSSLSMSLVFAFQVFLDISRLTEESFSSRFEQAKAEMVNNLCDLEESTLIIQELVHLSPDKCKTALANLDGINDKVFQEKKRISSATGYNPPESVRHRVFRYSPVLSGLFLFFFRTCFSVIALRDDPAPFVACGHLYHALRREELLRHGWPDMDTAIELLGENSFWMGGKRPETRRDCWKAILLRFGVSPSQLSNNTRPNANRSTGLTSNKRPVYSKAGTSLDYPMDTIRPYGPLRNMAHQMPGAAVDRSEFVWTPSEVKNLLVGRPGVTRHSWRDHRFLDSNENNSPSSRGILANMLSFKLYKETMDLAFPFLRLHRQSRALLKALWEKFKPMVTPGSELAYLVPSENLPSVVMVILQLSNRPEPEFAGVLEQAAEIVNEYLSSGEGSACFSAVTEAGLPCHIQVTVVPREKGNALIDAGALD
ncbi:unnamed protein product [Clonostachys rosea]|uniref:DUF6604 domain-containing protein n=1 Tax=Bionectria ochroleuca TaxID=29856 RepID=A0ABY6UP88_BIOOC|nr:unnamed protein product [Clonostachys rosea]